MLKDFSSWIEYEGSSEGSGRSEKVWLVNPVDGSIGLFKFPKTIYTAEHLSEKIASELAKLLNLKCMQVDIGVYNSRLGSLSYKVNNDNENLIEGIRLINKYYPFYDEETLYDKENNQYYSLEMILQSLSGYSFQNEFLKIPIFDFLIGNSDRHQSNWAILQDVNGSKMCPIYDNGSSLCCYVCESKIDSYLGNDRRRFMALADTQSKSRIRIDKTSKAEPTHLQVLAYLRDNYYDEVIGLITLIKDKIYDNNIDLILGDYAGLLSEKRRLLIKKFLLHKVHIITDQFSL